jgi:hypothetical protein
VCSSHTSRKKRPFTVGADFDQPRLQGVVLLIGDLVLDDDVVGGLDGLRPAGSPSPWHFELRVLPEAAKRSVAFEPASTAVPSFSCRCPTWISVMVISTFFVE